MSAAFAQTSGPLQDRRDALEFLDRDRTQRLRDAQVRPDVRLPGAPDLQWQPPTPGETPCFAIQRFELTAQGGVNTGEWGWLLSDLGDFANTCLGEKSLQALRQNMDARLLQQGFVTSSVNLPPQNLGSGTLLLQLVLGRVGRVVWSGPQPAPASSAVAVRQGAVLNLRDLEQTLENLGRLPSQASQFSIAPGEGAHTSTVTIAPRGQAVWGGAVAADNSAAQDYGTWQFTAQVRWDNPLGLADQLSVFTSRNLYDEAGTRRQSTAVLSYSVPWQYHLVSASVSRSAHNRPIQGASTRFDENGFDHSAQVRWQWTAWRSASARWALWAGVSERRSRNHIDDIELVLQRRHVRTQDWGLSGTLRQGAGEWSLEVEQSQSVRVPVNADFELEPPPLARSQRVQLGWQQAAWGKARYEAKALWAGVSSPATGADLQNLGSRWSVRGFDSRSFLTGKEQVSFKQDLRFNFMAVGPVQIQPQVALDWARVSNVGAAATPAAGAGHTLAGVALGLRWQWSSCSGDLTLAKPLHKPEGFSASKLVAYANFAVVF